MYRPKNCKKCGGKMQQGGLQLYTQSNTPAGSTTSTGQSSLATNSQLTPAQMQALASQYGFRTDSNVNLQTDLFNYAQSNQPNAYQQVMQKYGQTNAGTFADGLLGARTADLLSALRPQPQQISTPQPAQAKLTEHMFGPNMHALGLASQRYRDSSSVTDPGVINTTNPQEWIDFQYYQPNSANIDESRGRYRIPNSVWSNQITRGTTTIQDPSLIEQYRIPSQDAPMASLPVKMKGGRLMKMQSGGMPRQQDFPDYESWQAAIDEWMMAMQPQRMTQSTDLRELMGNFNQPLQESEVIPGVNAPLPEVANNQPLNRVQEGIQRGIIEGHREFPNGQAWYDHMQGVPNEQRPRNPYQTPQQIGIGMQAARTGLGWISGAVERGRQNQYDYMQQTALGMMNPMPTTDYQPNPYSLYAKYGGSLKKYQRGGNTPSTSDSLNLYNSVTNLKKYLDTHNFELRKDEDTSIDFMFDGKTRTPEEYFSKLDELNNKWSKNSNKVRTDLGKKRLKDIRAYENIDKNRFYQRIDGEDLNSDNFQVAVDTRIPGVLYDRRILPTHMEFYDQVNKNDPMYNTRHLVPMYDPITIKPYSMLTPDEKKIRDGVKVNSGKSVSKDTLKSVVRKPNMSGRPKTQFPDLTNDVSYSPQAPNITGPTPIPEPQRTNYSMTFPVEGYNQQKSVYFPNIESWRNGLKMYGKFVSSQEKGDGSSASASGYLQMGGMNRMKYGGLNNVKYFGPAFSNGATYKFSDAEKYDKTIVSRRLVPQLFLRGFINKRRLMKDGGIHIKPENKGKFTEYCGGKVTDECIQKGLNSPSATIRKRANFARNARKWN